MTETVTIGFRFTASKVNGTLDEDQIARRDALVAEDASLGRQGVRHTFDLPAKYKAGDQVDAVLAAYINDKLAADFGNAQSEHYGAARMADDMDAYAQRIAEAWNKYTVESRVTRGGGGKAVEAKVAEIVSRFADLFAPTIAEFMGNVPEYSGMNKTALMTEARAKAVLFAKGRGKQNTFPDITNDERRAMAVELWEKATEQANAAVARASGLADF